MLCLTARYRGRALRFEIAEGEQRIGSADDNEIVVAFPGVSRLHARLARHAGNVRIIDAGSKNGLRLAGLRVHEAALGPGVVVLAGSAALSLEDGPTSDVAVGLALPEANGRREPPRGRSSAREDDRRSTSDERSEPSAEAALGFIRRLERAGGRVRPAERPRVLSEARSLLGAEALLVLDAAAGPDPAVVLATGSLPPGDVVRNLGRGRRPAGAPTAVVARVDSPGTLLAAVFGTERLAAERWRGDFVDYVASKLGSSTGAARSTAPAELPPPSSPGALVLPPGMILGGSAALAKLIEEVGSTIRSRLDVLLLGETGTGKELFARLLHASGPTSQGPFVPINCAAIPGELLEAELFGVKGRTATGVDARSGLFVQANGGSIFLDEIGEMAQPLQAKLLRVLQEREVLPVGGSSPRKVDLRVISASNRDLPEDVTEGRFRSDLYYRLRGLQFRIPPLRERREDIPELALAFAQRASDAYGRRIRGLSCRAITLLVAHGWPGNVRELESDVERAVLSCPSGGVIDSSHFAAAGWASPRAIAAVAPHEVPVPGPPRAALRPLQEQLDAVERGAIAGALEAARGNRTLAARLLGITRNGLALKLSRLGRPGKT